MIHLFNKVYLDFDFNYRSDVDAIVISSILGTSTRHDEASALQYYSGLGTLINSGIDYNDLITNYTDEDDFFNSLTLLTNTTVIYVEMNEFIPLFVKMFKTILPNITSPYLRKIYNLTVDKHKFESKYMEDYNSQQLFNATYTKYDEAGFQLYFDAALPYTFSDSSFRNGVGIEFLMATYFNNPGSVFESEFDIRIDKLFWKYVGLELQELKLRLIGGLFKLDKMYPALTITPGETTIEDIVVQEPSLAFLTDPKVFDGDIVYLKATYDMSTLLGILSAINLIDGSVVNTNVAEIIDAGTVNTANIMALEVNNTTMEHRFLGHGSYMDKINNYLVDYVLYLKSTNDTVGLANLTMV